ncbi:MAG: peptidyl-tRNA hydrolase [Chthoniobacteraceae bacterium]|nr:peptidyl-tRNA hydrolase [Chthoniobacteraceae bacterium]
MQFRLIVGLGNPGAEYRDTRHNVGFMIVDRLALPAGGQFRKQKGWRADVAQVGGVYLCKPLAYMNLSGEAVRAMSDFYKITPDQVLVVLDDMALPIGRLRLRPGGSAGGHNGLKSVIAHLGTQEVPRLRFGIGAANAGEAVGHVLGRFAPEEKEAVKESIDRAVAAIEFAQAHSFDAAMNAYN